MTGTGSLLFNKVVTLPRKVETYEDFQNHVNDDQLIDGAYKIGVIGWEASKVGGPPVPAMLSPKSRLRSMEHVKKHSHAEASKRIDKRREQHYRRNRAPQGIEDVENERPHQKNRYQKRSDQCQ